MPVHSAGIVLWRLGAEVEILLVHPGGPFWAKKHEHAWSIPKGEFDPDGEDAFAAAAREFAEELGHPVPDAEAVALPPIRAGRKTIHPFLVAGDLDPDDIRSVEVEIEWPPRSGRTQQIPEVDRAAWVTVGDARAWLHKGQAPLVDAIRSALDARP